MYKTLIGLIALATATVGQAAIQIDFNNPTGNLGSNTQVYSNGSSSVTATGYSDFDFTTNTGTANNLFGKNDGGDEEGVGLVGDPSKQNEIWFAGDGFQTIPTIILDVNSLLSSASAAQFMMGSTTANEQWIVAGFDGSMWTALTSGTTEGSFVDLPGWGAFSEYAFISGGTLVRDQRTAGNVLLSALSLTPVPEPGTWAMMLLGFGAIGIAFRRKSASRELPTTA